MENENKEKDSQKVEKDNKSDNSEITSENRSDSAENSEFTQEQKSKNRGRKIGTRGAKKTNPVSAPESDSNSQSGNTLKQVESDNKGVNDNKVKDTHTLKNIQNQFDSFNIEESNNKVVENISLQNQKKDSSTSDDSDSQKPKEQKNYRSQNRSNNYKNRNRKDKDDFFMKQQNPAPENSTPELKQETELKPEIPVQEIKGNDNSQKVVSEQIVKTEDPVKYEAKIPAQKPAEKFQETIIPVQKNEPKPEQEKQPDAVKAGAQNRDGRNQRNKKPDNFNDNRRNNRSSFNNQGNQQSQENRGAQSNKQSGYQPGVSQQANYQINQGNRNPRREPDNRVDQKQRDKEVDNKEKPVRVNFKKVSIVIPLLNEEEALIPLANEIRKAFQAIPVPVEVVFVDDGSTDKSLKIIKDICRNDQRFKFLSFQRNYGKSAALNVGFRNVTGDVVITMDADLQDNPHEIPGLVKKLAEGYDLVSGWKKKRHDPFIKKQTSKLFNFVTGLLSGIKLHDFNCGLKAYRRNVVENLNIYGEMHRYIPILAHWKGFKVTEIPVKHQPRRFGVTKFGASRFYKGLVDLVTVMFITRYTKRPMHLFGLLGFLSFSAGLGINGYLSYIKLIEGLPLTERPLLFLGMLLMILGVQLFSTGLLGELMVHNFQNDKEYCIRESNLKQGSQGS